MTELVLWLQGHVPVRRQPGLQIALRKGASLPRRIGGKLVRPPAGAVWRDAVYAQVFPHQGTVDGEAAWRRTWLGTDGRVQVTGPVYVELVVYVPRPASHLRVDGMLSAEGLRTPYPDVRPDVDNYTKVALDALKTLALEDDGKVVDLDVRKRYAHPEHIGARLTIRSMVDPDPLVLSLPI